MLLQIHQNITCVFTTSPAGYVWAAGIYTRVHIVVLGQIVALCSLASSGFLRGQELLITLVYVAK